MPNSVFKTVQNSKGITAIQSQNCQNGINQLESKKSDYVALVWRSPYASLKSNQQLEKDLYRIYMKYYIRVMVESFGQFW